MTERLFHVAPDAVHVRMHYEPVTNTWTVHHAVVTHEQDGEVLSDPGEVYRYLSPEEVLQVVDDVLSSALGFG